MRLKPLPWSFHLSPPALCGSVPETYACGTVHWFILEILLGACCSLWGALRAAVGKAGALLS